MLSVQQIVFDLLAWNETAKLSDSDLRALLIPKLHFHMQSVSYLQQSEFNAVAKYRSQYNRGLLRNAPELCSFRYVNGLAVNRNDNTLTHDEQIATCQKYGINDERFIEKNVLHVTIGEDHVPRVS